MVSSRKNSLEQEDIDLDEEEHMHDRLNTESSAKSSTQKLTEDFVEDLPFETKLMYTEILMDHYRNPRCYGTLEKPTVKARDTNPSCGDVLEFSVFIDRDRTIKDIKFNGKGCAISQASASMLAESMMGKNVDDVSRLDKKQILDMIQVPVSMMRLKCALLCMKVLKMGVYQYLGRDSDDEDEQ